MNAVAGIAVNPYHTFADSPDGETFGDRADLRYLMKAEYRIKETSNAYTPQKRFWIFWVSLTSPLPSKGAASALIQRATMTCHPFFR